MVDFMVIIPQKEKCDPNNNFDLTASLSPFLLDNIGARMAPTARLDPWCARAKFAGQINVRTIERIIMVTPFP